MSTILIFSPPNYDDGFIKCICTEKLERFMFVGSMYLVEVSIDLFSFNGMVETGV